MNNQKGYRVGHCEVFKVPELEASIPTDFLYPDQSLATGSPENVTLSVHSWVVRTPDKTIVIDTGCGNGRERPASPLFHQLNTDWLTHLHDVGVEPDDVDLVLMTHLHGDHVGWNTHRVQNQWVPLFRRARYACSDTGLAGWQNDPARQTLLADSITPVMHAGLLETFSLQDAPVFADVLRVVPTPGHSHDHASIILESAGESALFTGDLMHNAIQVKQPGLTSRFCKNGDQAQTQRMWAMNWAADHQATWFSAHFAESSAGQITREGERFHWRYL